MAIIYSNDPDSIINDEPAIGAKYWWYKDPNVVLVLTVTNITYELNYDLQIVGFEVDIDWKHYFGAIWAGQPKHGTVAWNRKEWHKAVLKEYLEPMTEDKLADDEILCHLCGGYYFSCDKDCTISGCLLCDKDRPGTNKKRVELPKPKSRSSLHPPA